MHLNGWYNEHNSSYYGRIVFFFAFRYEKENVVFSTLEVVNEN